MSRIIILTGKGGVGKTSIASAHAIKSALSGKETLLVSTDMAHNLGDLFGVRIGNTITQLSEHLYGLELDPALIMQDHFPELNRSLTMLLTRSETAADKLSGDFMIPGMDTLFCLLEIASLSESGRYERIIVDCAPTGETLALLKLPELLSWYMEKFFPVGKTMVRALSSVSEHLYHMELPSAEGMDDIAVLHRALMGLQALLKDPEQTSVRIVCTPEKMVVAETRRNYMYLMLYGYQVDGLFINRMLPESAPDDFFKEWKALQADCLKELTESFFAVPITRLDWFPEDLKGMDALRTYVLPALEGGDSFFALRSPASFTSFERDENGWKLLLPIPLSPDARPEIIRNGQDLSVTLCGMTRRLMLPDSLRDLPMTKTEVTDDVVQILFSGGAACES